MKRSLYLCFALPLEVVNVHLYGSRFVGQPTRCFSVQLLVGKFVHHGLEQARFDHIKSSAIVVENRHRAVIIKTFVTTDLQKAIAAHHGVRCVETLTGFKYIGAKLTRYEQAIPADRRTGYPRLPESTTRQLRLEHSSFYVCGGEESYGYSGADFVRDKDGNGAVAMFAEVAAWAKTRGMTLDALLDEVYATYGYYAEKNGSLTFEGAEGADRIRRLAASYAEHPPETVDGSRVTGTRDFARDEITDVEGEPIPKEAMLMVTLADGRRFAVRPSGTEPKIKYYLFGCRLPEGGQALSSAALETAKAEVTAALESLWAWLQQDAHARLA